MITPPPKTHIILRLKPTVMVKGSPLDIVAEHNRIFDTSNRVGVGKFGDPWNPSKCDDFNQAIKKGRTIHLLLVAKTESGHRGFRATISSLRLMGNTQAPPPPHPEYYNEFRRVPAIYPHAFAAGPTMWFELGSRLEPYPLTSLTLLSNGRKLLDVLSKPCHASVMLCIPQSGAARAQARGGKAGPKRA